MSIHRYRFVGIAQNFQIQRQLPAVSVVTIGDFGPELQADFNLSDDSGLDDLTEYLSFRGWAFLETDPTTPLPGTGTILAWGNNSVGGTTSTRYLDPWGAQNQIAGTDGTTNPRHVAVRAGTIRNLFARHGNPDGNGNDITYTVRVDGVPTALTVTLASDGSQVSNSSVSVGVIKGATIDVAITKAAGIGNSPDGVTVQAEFA